MKKLKNEKGITLVALVVTIIVLIILATVSINLVMGDGGIIKQAERAAEAQANAEEHTTTALDNYANIIAAKLENLDSNNDEEEDDGNYIGKYVYYRNTKFMVYSQEDTTLTLVPLTFNNDYLLSGKYIIDGNGNKISVDENSPEAESAYTDESGEDFKERIVEELNNACQKLFGSSEGTTVTAMNAETGFFCDDIIQSIASSNVAINEATKTQLNAMVAQYKEKYDVTDQEIETNIQNEEITNYLIYWIVGPKMNLSDEEKTSINSTLNSLNKGEITLTNIPEAQRLQFEILQILCKLLYIDAIPEFWITVATNYDDDVARVYCFIDNQDVGIIYGDTSSVSYSLAPVLTVNASALSRVSGNIYQINVN